MWSGQLRTSRIRCQYLAASSYCRRTAQDDAPARAAIRRGSPESPRTDRSARSYAPRARHPGRLARRAIRAPAPRVDRAHRPVPAAPVATARAVSAGEREQIEAIVLEHRRQRTGIAASDELKVALRNLEAGNVATTAMAEQLPFERAEGTARLSPLASRRSERAPLTPLPEPPRDVQHVQVRQRRAGPGKPMVEIPRLDQRPVEALAVEAHEGAGTRQFVGHRHQQRPLVRQSHQHELPGHERPVARRTIRSRRGRRRCRPHR